MIAFSYVGMYCRHILAAVHFTFNLHRDVKRRNSDNTGQLKFTYPKFKNGEATVRNVRISLNFEYVEEIFQTFLSASSDDLKRAIAKLKELTPLPMNSMLQRESKTDAVKKKSDRSKRVVEDVPPTTPGKKAHIQLFHLFWGKGLAWEASSSMLYRDFNKTFPSLPHLATCRRNCGLEVSKEKCN
ncbi:PREDICTED: uncharacterized protein LOC107329403 [Acropora digitifera]|uniref:uncharacterized protein LOC107329403 n=1 Tax=Acropora digitifera TaxID=70779 RepID=UPI00077A8E27|nr:PREDICTED: uncharacterized protein LOC107329403 [Acropora digitifera]